MGWWDDFVVMMLGRDIAVLGPRGSGKTTLMAHFAGFDLPSEYEWTAGPTPTPAVRHSSAGFRVRKGLDLPGGQAHYEDWQRQFAKAQVVYYLFDVRCLQDEPSTEHLNVQANIRDDGRMIKKWNGSGKRTVHILGTHSDLDPRATELGAARYSDQLKDCDPIIALHQRTGARSIAVGSLKTKQSARDLLRYTVAG